MTNGRVGRPASAAEAFGLARTLTWFDGFSIALGVPALLLFSLGSIVVLTGTLSPLIWIVSVSIGLLQAFIFAEMASLFPRKSGGHSLYGAEGVPLEKAIGGAMLLCAAMPLVVGTTSNYVVVLAAMVACGAAWDVIYADSLMGVQFADPRVAGLMTGLFFSGTLGGVTLGALGVGALFDAIGVGGGLTVCAVAIALSGVWAARQPSAADPGPQAPQATGAP